MYTGNHANGHVAVWDGDLPIAMCVNLAGDAFGLTLILVW
jgi:hypothetical protein